MFNWLHSLNNLSLNLPAFCNIDPIQSQSLCFVWIEFDGNFCIWRWKAIIVFDKINKDSFCSLFQSFNVPTPHVSRYGMLGDKIIYFSEINEINFYVFFMHVEDVYEIIKKTYRIFAKRNKTKLTSWQIQKSLFLVSIFATVIVFFFIDSCVCSTIIIVPYPANAS